MKGDLTEVSKITKILTKSRMIIDEKHKELFINDLIRLIGEYFYLEDTPLMDVLNESNTLNVLLSFTCKGVKQFRSLQSNNIK